MSGLPPSPPSDEGIRQRLFETAIRLFARDGYDETPLRAIAREADVSPAVLARHFPSKPSFVMALYTELSERFAQTVRPLPRGRWYDRAHHALEHSLAILQPHRGTLCTVLPVLLTDRESGLLSPEAAHSRHQVMGVFVEAVTASRNAPDLGEALGRLLYLLQLGVLLWWLLDRSDAQKTSRRLIALLASLGRPAHMALWLPGVRSRLEELDALARTGLYGE